MADQLGKILNAAVPRDTPQAAPSGLPSSESETDLPSGQPTTTQRPILPVPDLAKGRGWSPDQEQDYAHNFSRLAHRLAMSGAPERYAQHSWAAWNGQRRQDALRWAGKPWALVVFGPPGTGKTHLATAVFADLLCRNWTGRWYEVAEALEEVKAEFDDDVRDGRTMHRLRDSPLLLLDDLGAERPTEFAIDRIGHVLRYRYSRELATIITTNHRSLTELDALDPRLSSRLGGNEAVQVNFGERQDWRLR